MKNDNLRNENSATISSFGERSSLVIALVSEGPDLYTKGLIFGVYNLIVYFLQYFPRQLIENWLGQFVTFSWTLNK